MSIIKRNGSPYWYFKFSVNGKTVFKSSGTEDRTKALEIENKVKAELFNQIRLGEKPRHLWQEAVIRWITESQKKSIDTDRYHFLWLAKYLDGLYLDQISKDTIENIITAKIKVTSPTRVNRTTELIRALLNKAKKEWEWIDNVPHIRRFKEPKKSPRWLTTEEANRLIAELPDHSKAMAIFTLATGLRESNVTHLEWSRVNLIDKICWIEPSQSKNGKLLRVELNQDAVNVLKQQRFKHPTRVFTYDGQPVEKVSTKSWRAALKRAGIQEFRWHDLRHTWASWHVQNGTPLQILRELGHWQSYEMVLAYAHHAPQHLAKYTANVSGILKEGVAKSVTPAKEDLLKIGVTN
ncbi:MAG: site-specific integrase [Methylococcaceae bacterium]